MNGFPINAPMHERATLKPQTRVVGRKPWGLTRVIEFRKREAVIDAKVQEHLARIQYEGYAQRGTHRVVRIETGTAE